MRLTANERTTVRVTRAPVAFGDQLIGAALGGGDRVPMSVPLTSERLAWSSE